MDSHERAWAAVFFDGEGWANRSGRGVQSRINQAGVDGVPEVLLKFKRIVGVGRFKGPLITEGKKDLYWWEATSRFDVADVCRLIAPWLGEVKRAEFERTLGLTLPGIVWPGTMSEEFVWAGGFFDGEGSTYLEKHRSHPGYRVPRLHVTQSSDMGVAPELIRFKSAVADLGTISGERRDKPDERPYRRWRAFSLADVQLGLHLLWPFIGNVKRAQTRMVMQVVLRQSDLARGNPAFGVAGARY